VVQAPEHVVENERLLAKAGDDPKKRRKVVRKKPPEGFIAWGQPTYDRLVAADPEPLTSSFKVTHAMLLNVISRPGDAFTALRHLLTDNHEDRAAQRRHIHQAIAIYRALLAGGVVERLDEPDADGRQVRLTVDLQFDFALNQPLSPLALAAIDLLDRESPSYPLDVVSIIEATLDNPRTVLSAQLFKARGEAVAQMKADGIDYDTRMDLLDSVTYPKPLDELLEAAYDMYRRGHPWVADYALAPKSVVRDMYERAMDVRGVRRVLRPVAVGGPGAALPWPTRTRRSATRSRPRPRPRSSPTSSSGSASWSARSTPACSTSGSSSATHPARWSPRRRRGRPPSPVTSARSGSWSATPCSAGSSWPRSATTRN